jgi:hypothetical protein
MAARLSLGGPPKFHPRPNLQKGCAPTAPLELIERESGRFGPEKMADQCYSGLVQTALRDLFGWRDAHTIRICPTHREMRTKVRRFDSLL